VFPLWPPLKASMNCLSSPAMFLTKSSVCGEGAGETAGVGLTDCRNV
jgi:hypothetical protein